MALIRTRQGGIRFLLLTMLLASPSTASAQRTATQLEELPVQELPLSLIAQLNHDSFATRQSAARTLCKAGLAEWQNDVGQNDVGQNDGKTADGQIVSALQGASGHASLEVRLAASRILHEISVAAQDVELERLLNPHCEASTIRLDHWLSFSTWVGDDMPARNAFANISRRLDRSHDLRRPTLEGTNSLRHWSDRLDPYRLDPEDTTAWMLLLTLDLEQVESLAHMTPRIAVALSHGPMGPALSDSVEGVVLGRLIDCWVRRAGPLCANRERLLIAMRYDRRQTARELCQSILLDDTVPPATAVTGLLVASLLDCEDWQTQATRRLEDNRVAHVWQMIPARNTKIRTEVRDVALALLLHQNGIDPRLAGFEELQADPLLRFCDHSLGFPDEASRLECRRRAAQLLAIETDLVVATQRD